MRKFIRYVTIALVTIELLIVSGCGNQNNVLQTRVNDIAFGVIDTKSSRSRTDVLFYDDNMVLVGSISVPYGNVGDTFSPVTVSKNEVLLFPGSVGLSSPKTVVALDLNTFSTRSYKIQTLSNHRDDIAANDKYIFVTMNANLQASIIRIDRVTGREKQADIRGCVYAPGLVAMQESIYVFCDEEDTNGVVNASGLHVLDNELTETNWYDTTEYGVTTNNALMIGDNLYFTPSSNSEGDEVSYVVNFSENTHKFTIIDTKKRAPWSITRQDESLLVGHRMRSGDSGKNAQTTVSIIDVNSHVVRNFPVSVPEGVCEHMVVHDDVLYVQSWDTIVAYSLPDLRLLQSTQIQREGSHGYVSGLFALP